MAGSLRAMVYTSDIGDGDGGVKSLILKLDESNAKLGGGVEATPGNLSGLTLADASDYQTFRPRYMLLEGVTSGNRPVKRKVVVCDPDNALFNSGGTTVMGVMVNNVSEAVTMTVTGNVGERRTFFKTVDTGLDDGSST